MPSMPNFPAQDPQAQFHFAQAIHHLAFLMTGSTLNAGTPHAPYQIPWPAPAPYMPPQPSHRQTSRHGGEESSSPGAGSSRSRRDVMSTPTHTSHPYPYSYDPRWSSSTLPPSSPPRSSSPIVSSPPTSPVPLRPALRERSRSRGRRVSFKLGDDDRPHVRPGEDDDDGEVDELLSTPDRLAILASPEIPVPSATRSRRGRSTESPSPGGSKGVLVEADDGRERGQTPGPPERSRSLARR
ncbi:hypothetical protein QCA50_006734 [Cerrena zonata]|uniref:Uncharacterized protein n=1 Tax=Cerrena zonata TaxID=2478898 RepID=A0AAW0G9H6_9APHY